MELEHTINQDSEPQKETRFHFLIGQALQKLDRPQIQAHSNNCLTLVTDFLTLHSRIKHGVSSIE